MVYPSSESSLTNTISSKLSTQIIVKVGTISVGAIQSLVITQNKDLRIREEIGTEGVIEIHPQKATYIDLSVNRIVFDELRMTEAFGRGFVNIQSQRIPFNIDIIDVSLLKNNRDAVIQMCHNCWFKNCVTSYNTSSYIVTETANLLCEYITAMKNLQNVASGGINEINYEFDSIERNTDLNGIRNRFIYSNFGGLK